MNERSLEAYYDGKLELWSQRCRDILTCLHEKGSATDREIRNYHGWIDMNEVRPRVNELIKDGVLEVLKVKRCPTTGKRVRVLKIKMRVDVRQLEMAL